MTRYLLAAADIVALPESDRHGTYSGWNRHRRVPEPPCGPCRQAATEYQRKRRAAAPLKPGGWRECRANVERLTEQVSALRKVAVVAEQLFTTVAADTDADLDEGFVAMVRATLDEWKAVS